MTCARNTNISMHWQRVAFALTFPLSVTLHPVCSNVILVPEPSLDSFVFLRVKERQENILVEPETDDQRYISSTWIIVLKPHKVAALPFFHSALMFFCIDTETADVISALVSSTREYVVDLEEGSQHLMRYRTIAPLVSSGAVQLIWM